NFGFSNNFLDVGLNFSGAASLLGGSGVVEFFKGHTDIQENDLRVRPVGGGTLTIGAGITVRNAAGSRFATLGDAAGGALVIEGTVLAQSPGQSLRVTGSSVSNHGSLHATSGVI